MIDTIFAVLVTLLAFYWGYMTLLFLVGFVSTYGWLCGILTIILDKYLTIGLKILIILTNNFDSFSIVRYGFTEVLNNAIEHSEASEIQVEFIFDEFNVEFRVVDDGLGIFNKIRSD